MGGFPIGNAGGGEVVSKGGAKSLPAHHPPHTFPILTRDDDDDAHHPPHTFPILAREDDDDDCGLRKELLCNTDCVDRTVLVSLSLDNRSYML